MEDGRSGHFRFWVAAIALLYLAGAAALAYARPPWCDEAWYGYPAWMLATAGHMGTPVLEGAGTTLRNIANYTYWEMPGHILAQAVSYKLLGINVFSTRLPPILWGGGALIAWYSILLSLTGRRRLALAATGLLATDYFFVLSAAIGRSDIMSTACGAAGLALYLRWREDHLRRAFVAGNALLTVCGLTHPNGGMLYLAMFGYLAWRFDRRRLGLADLAAGAVPYLVGAAAWGGYIAQDVEAFRTQFGGNSSGRFGNVIRPWKALYAEITLRYFVTFGITGDTAWGGVRALKSVVLAAYLAAAGTIMAVPALRRDGALRPVYHLALIVFAVLTLLDASKQHYYLLHLVPLLSALVAAAGLWAIDQRGPRRAAAMVMLAGLLAVQLGGIGYRAWKDERHRSYEPTAQFLAGAVKPGETVLATAALGFALDWPAWLHDDVRLGFFSGRTPDYFVIDDSYAGVHQAFAKENPAVYAFLETRKRQYRVVYENGVYTIFRKAGSAATR
jgi:4-amino-4-deoxy-L-arabinose transferase-like glycosyltransferase